MSVSSEVLIREADRLAVARPIPIDIVRLIQECGATVTTTCEASNTRKARIRGEVRVGERGYIVELKRAPDSPDWLTSRERFALAHELAHIMIDRASQWRPANRRDYFAREIVCNTVASRLLVPTDCLATASIESPSDAWRSLRRIRARCAVSWDVALRRICDDQSTVALALLQPVVDSKSSERLKVRCFSGAAVFHQSSQKFLDTEHAWRRLSSSISEQKRVNTLRDRTADWAVIGLSRAGSLLLGWARTRQGIVDPDEPRVRMSGAAQLEFDVDRP